jgi:hypothetical protein
MAAGTNAAAAAADPNNADRNAFDYVHGVCRLWAVAWRNVLLIPTPADCLLRLSPAP